ncbi:MAG: DNA methyltransferase [Dehalococcoidales bacterium]|nr:DNA methyltransferase [Dehalococcoidales bacterium]
MKVKIDDIKVIQEFYPRESLDNELVNTYRHSIGQLPPITLSKDLVLIDGYHRLVAHRIEGIAEIDVEEPFLDLTGDALYIEGIRRNAFHGKQLSMAEKRIAARRLHKNGNDKELITLLSVSDRTIDEWLKDLKAKEREQRNDEILNLYLQCYTQEEIAEKFTLERTTVSKILDNVKERIFAEIHTPQSLQFYNVWNFPKCDSNYGLNFPGRIPGQIIENLLYYYTQPFDIVIDPMSGGGTTLDVCKSMHRRYQAYDIKPVREDIQQHDISQGFPDKARGCNLIILDPPYWRLKDKEYSNESISAKSYDEWLGFMGSLVKNCNKVLRPAGYVALIIEAFFDEKINGGFLDLTFDCVNLFNTSGFNEVQRISIPMPTQIKSHHDIEYAKQKRILLDLNRDLVIFRSKKNGSK